MYSFYYQKKHNGCNKATITLLQDSEKPNQSLGANFERGKKREWWIIKSTECYCKCWTFIRKKGMECRRHKEDLMIIQKS